jgi:hypothetical protein
MGESRGLGWGVLRVRTPLFVRKVYQSKVEITRFESGTLLKKPKIVEPPPPFFENQP